MSRSTRCVVCDGDLGASWCVDHFDEPVCHRCDHLPRCLGCEANTGGEGSRARTVLADGRVRCRRCSEGAVDTRADMGPTLRAVRGLLQSYGMRLANRVRVELARLEEVATPDNPDRMAYTYVVHTGVGRPTVAALRIVEGLPATQFGRLLAHEMGHAWLAGCPDVGRTPRDDEGLCELVASWWLHHRCGRLARHLLAAMCQNPDPIYGEGFRTAARRASELSPAEVVARVGRTGRL